MKKLLLFLALAAAGLQGRADEYYLVGGCTECGWSEGETKRSTVRAYSADNTNWAWAGYISSTAEGDDGRFKIPNGNNAWYSGFFAPSQGTTITAQGVDLSTDGTDDRKFRLAETGYYLITFNTSDKKIYANKLTEPSKNGDYFLISSLDDYYYFAAYIATAETKNSKARLTADLSFEGKTFVPLASDKYRFGGEFDGNGHTIDYAKVVSTSFGKIGLFTYVTGGANIHDLIMGENCRFEGTNNVGGIAGIADGTGTVTLSNVINAATIHANNNENGTNAAGFVAFADGATVNVTNSANLGQTSTNGGDAKSAAFIGWISTAASFTNCWNGGTINDMDGTNNLYRTEQTITVDNCYDVSGGNCGQGTQLATTAKGSGELCYRLNGDPSDIKWYQTLHGTDSYPYPLDTHKQVYQVSETSYSNIPASEGKVQISDADDLVTFSAEVNAGNEALSAALIGDIDMTDVTYTPIGTDSHKYGGTFDGQGHRIKYLIIDTDVKEQGLFSVCTNATIKNLIMDASCSIKSTNGAWGNAAFVAVCNGTGTLTFENCGNEASVEGAAGNNAAFLGKNYSSGTGLKTVLTNCYNTGTIKGGGYNAAFVGESDGKEVTTTNCYNKGTVERNDGGNATWINGSGTKNITNCYTTLASGELTNLTTSYSSDKITSGELCYRLNGSTSGGTNWTQTIGTDTYPIPFNTSMLVFKNGSEYDNIEKDGDWYKISNANELKLFSSKVNAGSPALNAKLTNDIDMSGVNDYTPIGPSDNSKKYKGTFDGQNHYINLNIDNASGSRLGLIGFATAGAYVKNLIIKGSIKGEKYIGGFVGSLSRTDQDGTLTFENCGNEANITATDINAGGLLGCSFNGEVQVVMKNCYNSGTVKGNQSGQLTAWSTNTQIENCYTIGDSDNCDPFARLDGSKTITNCYCDTNLTWDGHPKQVTSEQIASGELCYLLMGTQETNAFTQAIGTDPYPTFGSETVGGGQWFGDDYIYYNIDESDNITVNELNLNENNTKYEVPAKVTAKSVTLTRTLHALTADGNQRRWNTFCSPVAIAKSNFFAAKELTGVTANGDNYSMTFTDVEGEVLEAGKPYMVQVSEGKSSLTASNVAVAETVTPVTINGLTYTGNFTNCNAPMGSFIISDNVFYNVDRTVALKAFRGYITVDSGSSVKALTFDFEDEEDGINSLTPALSEGEGAIYNVAGQRISKMQKGINIVNGRKVLF